MAALERPLDPRDQGADRVVGLELTRQQVRAMHAGVLERPRAAEWALRFPPIPARAVRIQVGWREEDSSWPAWSVPELQLYRSCR